MGPITRTSLKLISSLSRFSLSLSFALIVQHLQAKKIKPYKDSMSPHGSARRNFIAQINRKILTNVTTGAKVRAESSALFYPSIIHCFYRFVNPLFKKFFIFFKAIMYDKNVYRNKQQKTVKKQVVNSILYAFSRIFLPIFVTFEYLQIAIFAV